MAKIDDLPSPLNLVAHNVGLKMSAGTDGLSRGRAYRYGSVVKANLVAFIAALREEVERRSSGNLSVRVAADSLPRSATVSPVLLLARLVVCKKGRPEGPVTSLEPGDLLYEISSEIGGLMVTIVPVTRG